MNQYLLLRDNKQSGPYTVEELVAKGLKPYDLVWLEGKSAAWRYPSEMEDLLPYAPAVEEQPYDRFYKKPGADAVHDTAAMQPATSPHPEVTAAVNNTVEATKPITVGAANENMQDAPIEHTITSNKIHVTLPAGNHKLVVKNNTETKKEATLPEATKPESISEEAFANKETSKTSGVHFSQPAAREKIVVQQSVDNDVQERSINYNNYEQISAYPLNEAIQVVANNTTEPAPLEEQLRMAGKNSRTSKSNGYKIMLRGLVAASLILGGVIIGLLINRSAGVDQQNALDKLVYDLQQKEKQKQAANNSVIDPPAENTGTTDNSTNTTSTPEQEPSTKGAYAANDVTAPPTTSLPGGGEKQLTNKQDPAAGKAGNEPEMKIVPAVVTNKKEETTPRNTPNASYARENIHQLVSVEASQFKTGVLGGVSGLQLTVINGSLFAIDQVEVQINYLGPEKRIVKTQTIVFNDLSAGTQKTLDVPRTNRGVAINYQIRRIQSRELGIAHAGF